MNDVNRCIRGSIGRANRVALVEGLDAQGTGTKFEVNTKVETQRSLRRFAQLLPSNYFFFLEKNFLE